MTLEPRHVRVLNGAKIQLGEELSADAVLIAVTRRTGDATETFVVSDGNLHTLRGVAQYVYDQFIDDPDFEEDEDGEIEATDDDEGDHDGSG